MGLMDRHIPFLCLPIPPGLTDPAWPHGSCVASLTDPAWPHRSCLASLTDPAWPLSRIPPAQISTADSAGRARLGPRGLRRRRLRAFAKSLEGAGRPQPAPLPRERTERGWRQRLAVPAHHAQEHDAGGGVDVRGPGGSSSGDCPVTATLGGDAQAGRGQGGYVCQSWVGTLDRARGEGEVLILRCFLVLAKVDAECVKLAPLMCTRHKVSKLRQRVSFLSGISSS